MFRNRDDGSYALHNRDKLCDPRCTIKNSSQFSNELKIYTILFAALNLCVYVCMYVKYVSYVCM